VAVSRSITGEQVLTALTCSLGDAPRPVVRSATDDIRPDAPSPAEIIA
jgi:hypothetical protein